MNAFKKLAFLILLICPFILFSQDWKDTYNEYLGLFQEKKYDEAIEKSDGLLKKIAVMDTNYANTLYYLQYCFFYKEDYPNAIKTALDERKIRKELTGTNEPNYQNATYNSAVFYSYTAQYDSSVILMEEVIEYAKSQYGSESEYYLNITLQLANIFYLAGSNKQAEKRYDEVFETVKRIYKETDNYFMQVVNVVAPFYFSTGNYEKAEPFYVNATKSLYENKGELSQDYILSLNSLGEFYLRAAMYDKAETTFQEFVYVCEKFYGKKSADYATALNNLAVVYEKKGKNKEAEEYYLKSLEIKGKVFKKESDFYALTLSNLAVLYDNMGRYDEAKALLEQVIDIYKAIYGEENLNYANALNSLSSVYSSYGKNKEAIELLEKAMEIQKKNGGEKYDAYINSLNNIALIHDQIGETEKAEKEFEKTIELRKEVQGINHVDYAVALYNLANIKMQKGDYAAAGKLFFESLEIHRTNSGEYNTSYANTLNSIAALYSFKGNYNEAEKTYLRCGEIYRKIYGPLHPEYATYLSNLGLFYYETGNYNESEINLLNSLEIITNAFGPVHPDNIYPMTHLSSTLMAKGNYRQAENYLNESLRILKENYGVDHQDYVATLSGLGVFYYNTGNYDKAEMCYLEALEKYKKIYGENHTSHSSSLNNLGALYLTKAIESKDLLEVNTLMSKSEKYFLLALKTDSVIMGTNHPDYAIHLNNLGEVYRNSGQTEKAEKMLLKTIEIEKQIFGEDYPDIAITYNNLSLLYAGIPDYVKAEKYCLKALNIKESAFGVNHPSCSGTMSSLAYIYENSNRADKAKELYLRSLRLNYEIIKANFAFLSEEEKTNYLKTISIYNEMFLAFATKYYINDPEITATIYNNELINKGILLRSTSKMKNTILNSKNPDLISTYNNWISIKQEIAKLYSLPVNQRYENTATLEEKANELEKSLVVQSTEFGNDEKLFDCNWQQIKNSLKKTEAAIEFIQVNRLTDNQYENFYYAVIINPNSSAPVLRYLCNEKDLNEQLKGYSGDNIKYLMKIYNTGSEVNKKLYQLIWEPVEGELNGITTVYYSPSGVLNKLSFSCIYHPSGKYLSASYHLVLLTTTGKIPYQTDEIMVRKSNRAGIFGGSVFSSDTTSISAGDWKYLEGTKEEADKISDIFSRSKMITDKYTGIEASEYQFKMLDENESPDIIHIATHGFFFPDPMAASGSETEKAESAVLAFRGGNGENMENFSLSKNPLMRSGLVFSGANDDHSIKDSKNDDGILTALEASNLNLENTSLIVMSACETGLGDIKGSEGVYGLQRAFKIAGVKYIIMSLWQVPDKETSEFMIGFYNELLKTNNVKQAFYQTQKLMRSKYDPYYWGAFVLIE